MSWLSGLPVVMLTTTGARTGQQRTLPVIAVPDGDNLVVIASNWGQRRHPAWYHNLRAHPEATVTVGGVSRRVRAHEAVGEERDRLWQRDLEVSGADRVCAARRESAHPRGGAGSGAGQAELTGKSPVSPRRANLVRSPSLI